jgi:hypothetical protein
MGWLVCAYRQMTFLMRRGLGAASSLYAAKKLIWHVYANPIMAVVAKGGRAQGCQRAYVCMCSASVGTERAMPCMWGGADVCVGEWVGEWVGVRGVSRLSTWVRSCMCRVSRSNAHARHARGLCPHAHTHTDTLTHIHTLTGRERECVCAYEGCTRTDGLKDALVPVERLHTAGRAIWVGAGG